MFRAIINFIFCISLAMSSNNIAASDYLIGTYYFPGWTNNAAGLVYPKPWDPIKNYPEKIPQLGWYSDSDPFVVRQQIQWMRSYGIKFVAFDWYWDQNGTYLEHALNAFRLSKSPGGMKFTLLWANHDAISGGMDEYKKLVRYWVDHYFHDSDFLKIDGKPVIFLFSLDFFSARATSIGVQPLELVQVANAIAKQGGFPGIYFVGGVAPSQSLVNSVAPAAGISALSAYNYQTDFKTNVVGVPATEPGYASLDGTYRRYWDWLLTNSSLPYIVPMTSGWDKRPWGGSTNPNMDNSISTPAQFESHLSAAKALMDTYPDKTLKMGIICCWNEFGEGSYIEPTQKDGLIYLEKVKKVFGAP